MSTITVELKLPEELYLALKAAGLSREELGARALRDIATQLYLEGRLSLGRAAQLAGLSRQAFWSLLQSRNLPVFPYTEEDYDADVAVIRQLNAGKSGAK